jgi:hypothetical protein
MEVELQNDDNDMAYLRSGEVFVFLSEKTK